jgi:uncharacterized membrane protein
LNVEEYLIGSPAWVWPAGIAMAVLAGTTLVTYLRSGLTAWRGAAMLLKLTAIAILAVCLIEPLGRGTRPRPQANLLPILVDQSQSMRVANVSGGESDAARLGAIFSGEPAWLTEAEQMFELRRYVFDARLQQTDTLDQVAFEGTSSNLVSALQTVGRRYRERPVAGVLLFSDGNITDELGNVAWKDLGFPVFPVRDEDSELLRDLRIGAVSVSETSFETAPVTISAAIEATGLEGREALVRLLTAGGELIEEQTLDLQSAERTVQFRFRPESAGVTFYRLQCVLGDEPRALERSASRWEATLRNNERSITVNQRRGPFDVLYVAGRPNWEFKYLRRALDKDAEVRLVGLLRIAKKQPKFSFRDATVESSANPLFAGLGGSEEEAAEQLDEAVIVRLGVKEASELPGGFPDNTDELFPFAAVILDDVEAAFFSQDQLLALRQFVSMRGGALLMLGGDDALEKGAYAETPLGELAPVYFPSGPRQAEQREAEQREAEPGPYRFNLTRQGMLEPFLRLRSTEEEERRRLSESVPLRVLNRVGRVKPGASVLAEVSSRDATLPALVTQPFGRGKSSALLVGDLWRWSLHRAAQSEAWEPGQGPERDDPAQLWRQIVRWLVSDVPQPVEGRVEAAEDARAVRLEVDVRSSEFAPLDDAEVSVDVTQPDGSSLQLRAEPEMAKAGQYALDFWPRQAGGYRATITATAADGSEIGAAEIGWSSNPAEREFARIGSNAQLLRSIAQQTGGRVLALDELNAFTDELSRRPVPVREAWVFPLWHRWWVCGLALLCLCGEWGIRRWKGLA